MVGFGHEQLDVYRLLDRIVAMLTKLGQRGYSVREEAAGYGEEMTDTDADTDSDPETAQ